MANPVMISLNRLQPLSSSGVPRKIMNIRPMPRRPRLATESPMTAPPLKATRSALACPSDRAASLVRVLDMVAASIPNNPARIEQIPPNKYATAVFQLSARPSRTATTTRNGKRYEYSRFRNVIAPV